MSLKEKLEIEEGKNLLKLMIDLNTKIGRLEQKKEESDKKIDKLIEKLDNFISENTLERLERSIGELSHSELENMNNKVDMSDEYFFENMKYSNRHK